jgi:hypothetical protein
VWATVCSRVFGFEEACTSHTKLSNTACAQVQSRQSGIMLFAARALMKKRVPVRYWSRWRFECASMRTEWFARQTTSRGRNRRGYWRLPSRGQKTAA